VWPLVLGAVGTLYVMLVVAPRAIADPGAGGVAWVVRFAFLVGSIAAAAALGVREPARVGYDQRARPRSSVDRAQPS
jgi:hypothetical protein